MKWNKLGRIFYPQKYELANGCSEFAQSPQTLVFDDFIRIYFSTRSKDQHGKYLSHIAFIDIDKDFREVIGVSRHTVIDLGDLGSFDEHGIFPMNVLRERDRIIAYTSGWSRRVSVSVETSIGIASSEDNGLTFSRMGTGPILTSSLQEPFLVGDPFVSVFGEVYHMWYIYGTKWIGCSESGAAERVYKIGHATSNNGIDWCQEHRELIPSRLHEDECQALPTVAHWNDRYHMWFCYRQAIGFRENRERSYRIGYAHSEDLKSWIRDDSQSGIDVSEHGWDSQMLCYPHVFECDQKLHLLYNGNQFGRRGFGVAVLDE